MKAALQEITKLHRLQSSEASSASHFLDTFPDILELQEVKRVGFCILDQLELHSKTIPQKQNKTLRKPTNIVRQFGKGVHI